MSVWILTLEGMSALEQPYAHAAPYSSEQRALHAMLDWLVADGCSIPESFRDGKLTHEDVDNVAQEHFGTYESDCGPQDWSLVCLEQDKPFHDTIDKQDENEVESRFLRDELDRSSGTG